LAEVSNNIGYNFRKLRHGNRSSVQNGNTPAGGKQRVHQMRADKPASSDDESVGSVFTQCLNHHESAYEQGISS
jgi:hypothetical protein